MTTIALAGVELVSSSARADAGDDLIRQGVELRRDGKDQEALEAFRRANTLAPTPRAQAQMGWAEQALGRWSDAYDHVDGALQVKGDPWIVKNRSVLESSLATIRKHVGELEILGEPAGAEVRVDGRLRGTLPVVRRIYTAAGTVLVEVRAPGYLTVGRAVVVSLDDLTRETIVLQPITRTGAPVPPGLSGAPPVIEGPATGGPADQRKSPPSDDGTPASWRRPLMWTAVVGAGVLALGGGIALGVRESKAKWFSDPARACDENTPGKGGAGCQDAYDSGHTAGTLAIGSFIGAGVLGAGAAVLFLTSDRSARTPGGAAGTAVGFACAPAAAGVGVTCATRF